MDKQDIVLEYVRKNGPVIPIEIGKLLRCDSLIASAMLSGLTSMNQLKMSKMKIGGSPLYYAPGQEEMLQNFAEKLAMGEKGAFNLLKSRKILMDKHLNPIQKEALQRIKDFAIMLEVELPGKGIKEVFWKWYLLSDSETESMIKDALRKAYAPAPKPEKPKQIRPEAPKEKERKIEEVIQEKIIEPETVAPVSDQKLEKAERKEAKRKEKADKPKREIKRKILRKKELDTKPEEEKKSTKFKIEEELLKIQEEEKEAQKKDKPKTPAMIEKEQRVSDFMQKIHDYFKKNDIVVAETDVIKPNEIDFVVKVPSAVGKISYYCKAKDKKTVNEGDLSTAYVQGQVKKLPILFLSSGKLTKRAEEMLEKQFQHMNIAYLDQQ